jgi:hypothetical protein
MRHPPSSRVRDRPSAPLGASAVSDVSVSIEVTRIARLLGVDEAELAFLSRQPAAALRELHDALREEVLGDILPRIRRFSSLTRAVAPMVTARLAEEFDDATISAVILAEVEPRRAARVAQYLSPGFLARIAANGDPVVVARVVPHVRARTLGSILTVLLDADDLATISQIVALVPAADIARLVLTVEWPAMVLDVAARLDDGAVLTSIVAAIPDAETPNLIARVAGGAKVADFDRLLDQLDDEQRSRVELARATL